MHDLGNAFLTAPIRAFDQDRQAGTRHLAGQRQQLFTARQTMARSPNAMKTAGRLRRRRLTSSAGFLTSCALISIQVVVSVPIRRNARRVPIANH